MRRPVARPLALLGGTRRAGMHRRITRPLAFGGSGCQAHGPTRCAWFALRSMMCDLEVHTVNVTTDDESRTRSALCFVGLKRASDRLIRVATIWSN